MYTQLYAYCIYQVIRKQRNILQSVPSFLQCYIENHADFISNQRKRKETNESELRIRGEDENYITHNGYFLLRMRVQNDTSEQLLNIKPNKFRENSIALSDGWSHLPFGVWGTGTLLISGLITYEMCHLYKSQSIFYFLSKRNN